MKNRFDWESLLFALTVMFLLFLAGLLITLRTAHAAACLSIDVPPQAVLNVHDGDTFTVFSMQPGGAIKYRIEGVDTPELRKRAGEPDQPGAAEAREFTRQWLSKGVFTINTCGKPTLDRVVASVSRKGEKLADALKAAGLGR